MRLLFIVFSLAFLTTSCEKSNENANEICFKRTTTGLQIENKSNKEYYFVAFGQGVLALIDWIPICNDNSISIQPHSTVSKPFSLITGYSDSEPVVVYWWECKENKAGELKHVILEKNQTACK